MTDPDVVPIEECPLDALEHFRSLLDRYPDLHKAGFGLRIDDLPEQYVGRTGAPLGGPILGRRARTGGVPRRHRHDLRAVPTDASSPRHYAVRTGFPYVARHFPWYQNSAAALTEESGYHVTTRTRSSPTGIAIGCCCGSSGGWRSTHPPTNRDAARRSAGRGCARALDRHGPVSAGALALDALRLVVERSSVPTEIVVVDNASPDVGCARPVGDTGTKFFANESNRLAAMEPGVAAATSAPIVVLLNPDVVVQPGWTSSSSQHFGASSRPPPSRRYPRPDGSVQEAGGAARRRARIHPSDRRFRAAGCRRRARRRTGRQAGGRTGAARSSSTQAGFDLRYHPAYFEDADLCFRFRAAEIRRAGQHHRGGTDVDDRARFIAKASHEIFVERWRAELARRAEFLAGPGERTALLRRLPG
ncbi:MAG: hypothetical protein R2715_10315 [Ilumatobacteraceae bacterium]